MMKALIFSMFIVWSHVPDDCDPIRFIYQPRPMQEIYADMGYLIWMHNCLMQQEYQEQQHDPI